ncbi:MAG: hypothetical protein H0T39_13260 [Actinobacteria bacterium]|nr:hypothetical protein [Actinomycetota bacterium]
MKRASFCMCAALLVAGAASAATSNRFFPRQDAWVDVPGTIVSCSWQRERVDFVSCDLRGAPDRLAATLSGEELAVFRFSPSGRPRLVRRFRHETRSATGAAAGRSQERVPGRAAATYSFPAAGRYLRVPGTRIGCSAGSLRARRLVVCQLLEQSGSYSFVLSESYVTVVRLRANGGRPVVVWGRTQPGS